MTSFVRQQLTQQLITARVLVMASTIPHTHICRALQRNVYIVKTLA